jgi:hypothetical protein
MSSGDKKVRERGAYTLTVRGDVTVQISRTAVSARRASVLKAGDQITVDNMGAILPAKPSASSKYVCKNVYGPMGDGCVQVNVFTSGSGHRPPAADTLTQVPIKHGRAIDVIEVFDNARVVISYDNVIAGNVRLEVSGNGAIVLPRGQVHRVKAIVSESGTIAGPNANECMWASEAKIVASDEGRVEGIKVLSEAKARATDAATVSIIAAKDAKTVIEGAVNVTRVK